jgi:GT2 family glycosyltransferase
MTSPSERRSNVTVVIPTLGRPVIRRALHAVADGSRQPAELIVVDQGRSPEVEAMLRELVARGIAARWIPSSERGRALAVNRGIEAATTSFVAITDDDCIVFPDWLERLEAILDADPGRIVTGRVEAGDETVLSKVVSPVPFTQRRPGLAFDHLSGGNMALSKDTVSRIGGLDEDPCLQTAEDAEFAYRALRANVPIQYAPDVAVTHLGWRDDAARGVQYDAYARSHGGFYGKYIRRGDAFIALRALLHWGRALRRWVLSTLRGDVERARNARAYVLGLYAGIREGWRNSTVRSG